MFAGVSGPCSLLSSDLHKQSGELCIGHPDCTRVYHPQTSVNSAASVAAIAQRARADECSCEGPQMKSKIRKRWHLIGSMLGLTLLAAVNQWAWAAGPQTRGPERIEHIVIIYLENRSFDNLYGH